jgi:hypothetical protein
VGNSLDNEAKPVILRNIEPAEPAIMRASMVLPHAAAVVSPESSNFNALPRAAWGWAFLCLEVCGS